jgi:capsular exopolysaccharide synthesis family protein
VAPRVPLNLAAGLLIGFALGALGAVLREQVDTAVRSAEDVDALTGAIPLGIVPFDPAARAHPLVTRHDTGTRVEAFRTLRTNLQFADVDCPPRAVVVTSSMPGEGKTTSACSIAITLALAGAKVVLVDADLRRPGACEYLDLEGAVGLTDVLAGRYELDDVLVHREAGTLAVLPSGPVPPNPSELLASRHMAALLVELRARYDYVIIDTPPLLPVTDAAIMATLCDGALVLIRQGRTSRHDLEHTMHLLQSVNARMLGTVLNFAPRRGNGRRYGYGYGYRCAPRPSDTSRIDLDAVPEPAGSPEHP